MTTINTNNTANVIVNEAANSDVGNTISPTSVPMRSARANAPEVTVEAAHSDAEVITPHNRVEYVNLFRKSEAKTARATLEMCRLVYEAKKTLDECDFHAFCQEIGYKDGSATIRKYLAIGKVQPRMIQYAEKMPASWTSIYLLTQIPASVFEKMLDDGKSFKHLKVKDLQELVDETRERNSISGVLPKDKVQQVPVFARVAFTKPSIDHHDLRIIRKAFFELEARLPVRFLIDSRALDIFERDKSALYEKCKIKAVKEEVRPDMWDYGREANAATQKKLTTALTSSGIGDVAA